MTEDAERGGPKDRPVCLFRTRDGKRIAVVAEKVEALVELHDSCQITTGSDVFRVAHPFPQVAGVIWTELFR